ncbi:MAG: DNA repair exonuclease [Hyphomicrobiaceae bacterium]
MSFAFIHTADWQLGKTFKRMAPDKAGRLEAARLDAIDGIGELAMRSDVQHVLVAGDVFDNEHVADSLLRAAMSRMAAWGGLTWQLLAGNHDLARPGGVWERLQRLGIAANVRPRLVSEAVDLTAGVTLLAAPLRSRSSDGDPTLWMDQWASAEGTIRIGLAHGSVQGFGSLGEASVLIDPARRASARLDYLALGDWHGTREIAEGVWYSGTPEPERYVANDPGNALVVRIDGPGSLPVVEVVRVATYSWVAQRVVVARLADLEPIERGVDKLGPAQARQLLRLKIEGGMTAEEMAQMGERLAALEARLMALEVDATQLRTSFRPEDLASLGEAGAGLRAVAERLAARSKTGDRDRLPGCGAGAHAIAGAGATC